jgi:hypothetical protein
MRLPGLFAALRKRGSSLDPTADIGARTNGRRHLGENASDEPLAARI